MKTIIPDNPLSKEEFMWKEFRKFLHSYNVYNEFMYNVAQRQSKDPLAWCKRHAMENRGIIDSHAGWSSTPQTMLPPTGWGDIHRAWSGQGYSNAQKAWQEYEEKQVLIQLSATLVDSLMDKREESHLKEEEDTTQDRYSKSYYTTD